ncbi:MAG: phage tail protein [Geopsychrobacter sp.]|nr:phage tail protein [Geopsychrobacter sp.]
MSAPTVGISFNHSLEELSREFGATLAQIDKARTRAVRKLRKWLQTQLARELAQAVGTQQKALKPRFHHSIYREGRTLWAHIWIGVNPIDAHRTGRPRQLKKGVRVHQNLFEKAFFVNVYGDEKKVWQRKGKGRFPVIKVQVPIAEQMREILPRYEGPAAAKLAQIFEHELKFEAGWFD